jgi:trehalose/maltose hydrolase-like predicted phosphorylase
VHAYLNQLVGDKRLSWEMFKEAVTSDYVDIQGGTTAEGIHAGVMAGTVWLVYSAFAGIDFTGEIIAFKPALPVHWNSLELKFQFKGNDYSLELTHHKLILECNAKADFKVNGIAYQTHADKAITVDL